MPRATRSELPFGSVMATGAASQLAGPAGIGAWRVPLLWASVAVAVAVVASGVSTRSWRHHGRPAGRFGLFTVPIGLAVIGSGLARLGGQAAVAGAEGVVLSAWLATGLLVATVVVPVAASPPGLDAVGGAWFLAPAALLADAIGVAAVAGHGPGRDPAVGWAAVAAAGLGAAGYVVFVGLAAARVAVHRLAGAPAAPWWIVAGCGGLSAAAIGRVSTLHPLRGGVPLPELGRVALVLWAVGSLALVPVVAGSVRYLARLRQVSGRPPWPPTFSTGVYALGAGQVGRMLGAAPITDLADVAALATVCLWALTVLASLPRLGGRR